MAPEPERTPGNPGASGAPIQPGEAAVPEAWLVEAGHRDLADNIDRLAADVDLITDLGLANFEGPLWDFFANELAKYGMAVIASWCGRNTIFDRCKK